MFNQLIPYQLELLQWFRQCLNWSSNGNREVVVGMEAAKLPLNIADRWGGILIIDQV